VPTVNEASSDAIFVQVVVVVTANALCMASESEAA